MIFYLFLSFLVDFWLEYYLPFLPDFFIFLQPMLFVTTVLSFLILKSKNKKILKLLFVSILIYDLLFSRIYFLRFIIFLFLYKMISYLKQYWNFSFFSYIMLIILGLIGYLFLQYIILLGIGIIDYSISFLFRVVFHSLLLNVIYGMILYSFLGIKKRKA